MIVPRPPARKYAICAGFAASEGPRGAPARVTVFRSMFRAVGQTCEHRAVHLEPRGRRPAPLVFRQGARAPYGIRWYGATSLFGHFRNLVSSAIASESIDSRDWMRPLPASEMLERVAQVLGLDKSVSKGGPTRPTTLLEHLDRPLWIDWVADTGDDRDVSEAVARMVFAEYTVDGASGGDEGPIELPRGDVLLFGGDTAYPVATADEIHRRVTQPWNEVLRSLGDAGARPRVLLGIPGNHDWYDGLDGFARFFRREVDSPETREEPGVESIAQPRGGRTLGRVERLLHLDEVGSVVRMFANVARGVRAFWSGKSLHRRGRLGLMGYEPVQESSYWALPLAPGLDLWGVDRQLGRLDYRQRAYFLQRREAVGTDARLWFVAPDPALAFGEPWEIGQKMLEGCGVALERDRVLYQCGDMHHYERRAAGGSMHVIAGGGGAFLHGTRIVADPRPADAAYPDAAASRRLALQVPFKLMLGRSGYLVHIAAALVTSLELAIGWHHFQRFVWTSAAVTLGVTVFLYAIAGHQRAHPWRVLALAVPFGAGLGLLPLGLSIALRAAAQVLPLLGRDTAVMVVDAFASALLVGVFFALCALGGLEMQQVYTVLGHPGFKHFVRMRVSPDGTIDAWVIGKDDPLARDGPWLVDRWTFR
jgi:hypothetical protein